MLDFFYIEINLIMLLISFMMLFNINRRRRLRPSTDQKLFDGLLILNACTCLFDMAMWILPGFSGPFARTLHILASVLYYLVNPLMCYLWLLYTDYKLCENRAAMIRRAKLYALPLIPLSIVALLSPWTAWYFSINAENVYVRGPLFWFMALPALCFLLGAMLMTLADLFKSGAMRDRIVYQQLLLLPLAMLIAALVQALHYGLTLVSACSTLVFLGLFINMQNVTNDTDPLTTLFNRRRLDQHLRLLTRNPPTEALLFCILIDLDDFKSINDTHGHLTGDQALLATTQLLQAIRAGRDDFLARIGGDEFMIVGTRASEAELLALLASLETQQRCFNDSAKEPYQIKLSMGLSIYSETDSIDDLIGRADAAMYTMKQAHKQAKQSPEAT